jgi:uncharacterized repeat protein (TIGR01451 family)
MSRSRNVLRGRGRRPWSVGVAAIVAVAVFGVLFVASSGATLAPSTFEGNDGNMVVDTPGNTDWASLAGNAGLRTLVDLPSGTNDNAFGQGTKEDDTTVTVVKGSIPPNKNDLTRAYVYEDRVGGSSFIDLAWERAAAIGDAHIDFELNQNATAGFDASTTGTVQLNRTPGDLLISYDFSGSGTPTITLYTWDGTAWSNPQDLSALGFAEAAVNTTAIADVLNNGATLAPGEFGEASINLSDALLAAGFNQDTCQSFGSIMVKARSSGESVDSELKDFIAPVPFHASNCATPTIATQTGVSSMTLGQTTVVGDTATLTGGDSVSGDVSFQLYSDASCQTAVTGVGGSATLDTSGVAAFSGASFTPDHPGTYYWGVSYAGDSHNNPASACGGTNEEIVVAKASPSVSTTQQPASGAAGDTFNDTATVSGAVHADGTGSITFTLYPAADCGGTVVDQETVGGISGDGDYTTPKGTRISQPGTYYWVASFSGDSNNSAFTSGCNDEPVSVAGLNTPSITTALSSASGNTGATVHDSATLTGATADAGGTVTYSVYSDSSCTTKAADGGTVTVTNDSVPNSSDVTFSKPGTYYWQASYSGDANNAAATSACTDEQLVISPLIDLAVTKVGSPNPVEVGNNITWTIIVTNNGPDTATGATISDPMPAGNAFVSATTSQGSCTGGAILQCNLDTIPAGASVTITLVTTPSEAGTVTNSVTVVGSETETNTANNTASASVVVNQLTPPSPPTVFCVAVSKVTPKQLFVGRKTTLTIRLTKHGKAASGYRVKIKGPKINLSTKPSNHKGVVKQVVKMKKAGIVTFTPIASKRCNTKRVGVTGVFTPPVTG